MRELSNTLTVAQKAASHTPYVRVDARNRVAGIVRFDWKRLYTGSEDDYFHGMTMPGNGALVRVRIGPPSDSRKLYRQTVSEPGPLSDFSNWTYVGQYNCVCMAVASQGAEVSIFWVNTSNAVRRIKSTDYGVSWGSPELIDYCITAGVALAAAYKPNGDLALFFADGPTFYVKKCLGGNWQSKVAWDKTTGTLSGAAATYDADWNLWVTGQDMAGNYMLWSLVYGDGGEVSVGTWSALRGFASAPAGGNFEYGCPFLDKPDVYRGLYAEKFSGTQSYDRPFWSHTVTGSTFTEGLWHEPIPMELAGEYGLAMAHHGDYCWMTSPSGVWRASLAEQGLDLTADVLSVRQETHPGGGGLTVELRNDDGQYASPGEGALSMLHIGCQIEFGPGCVTSEGEECSPCLAYWLEAFEYVSRGGKASVVLHAPDSWRLIGSWRARHQFRWNKDSDEMPVKDILAFVLARVGMKLGVQSQSSVITGYYPDFTVHPGNRGDDIVRRLLSFVPDVLFIEGNIAYIVNPQSSDSSVYSYGQDHDILEGRYRHGAWGFNRVRVEGLDPVGGTAIIVDSFSWEQIARLHDRLTLIDDSNIDTVVRAEERGDAYLREAEIESVEGMIRVPVNCGQQLYDVIDITDIRAGLSEGKRRVVAITLAYLPERGEYEQRLSLGAV
ncbi:MAG TPA: hypothetical protein G4O18_06605 [Dehalococcoidia bacterium]|nr:hypothetical protein [Dehalococcoidia bacterium]